MDNVLLVTPVFPSDIQIDKERSLMHSSNSCSSCDSTDSITSILRKTPVQYDVSDSLVNAIRTFDIPSVYYLLNKLDAGTINYPVLFYIIVNGKFRKYDKKKILICRLLNMGININMCGGRHEMPPILVATMLKYTDVVRLLLSRGANIHAIDKYGRTSLIRAMLGGNVILIKELIIWRADISLLITYEGVEDINMLMFAIKTMIVDKDIIQYLVNNLDRDGMVDSTGRSAIHYAIKYSNPIALLCLKEHVESRVYFPIEDVINWNYITCGNL